MQTRVEASRGLSLESFGYLTLKRLDRRMELRALILKACTCCPDGAMVVGYRFLQTLAASPEPVAVLNRRYLQDHGRGWLFGNPAWMYQRETAGMVISHDLITDLAIKTIHGCLDGSKV